MIVVVTGLPASGKSTVCKRLASYMPGAVHISIDDVVDYLWDAGIFVDITNFASKHEAAASIKTATDYWDMAAQLGPFVLHQLILRIESFRKPNHGNLPNPLVLLEFPTYFEHSYSGVDFDVDFVINVKTNEHLRMKRLMARPEMTEQKAAALGGSQTVAALKAELADYNLENDGTPELITKAIIDARAKILELYADRAFRVFGSSRINSALHSAYREGENRGYHNKAHIGDLVSQLTVVPVSSFVELFGDSDVSPAGLEHEALIARSAALTGICFHDFIQDYTGEDELKSVRAMMNKMSDHVSMDNLASVWEHYLSNGADLIRGAAKLNYRIREHTVLASEMILSTAGRTVPSAGILNRSQIMREVAQYFLDCDASMFILPTELALHFQSNIMSEIEANIKTERTSDAKKVTIAGRMAWLEQYRKRAETIGIFSSETFIQRHPGCNERAIEVIDAMIADLTQQQ